LDSPTWRVLDAGFLGSTGGCDAPADAAFGRNLRSTQREDITPVGVSLAQHAILQVRPDEDAPMNIAAARLVAFDILLKVESGGYASDLLLLHCAALDARDAGLAAEIVFGVLRYRAQLDFLIRHHSGRARKLDLAVRVALRMGFYQIRYLERVPPHAAVKDSVELVKRAHKTSAAGFVNALLRQANRDPVAWPSREIELSCPEWLLSRWEAAFGAETAAGIAQAALREPEKYIRLSPSGDRTQDIGSQSIVPLLGLEPGMRFLDLCAAPGNKTAQALEAGVVAVAADVHFHRLVQLKPLGAQLVVLDGTRPLPFSRLFDRILVDAPCSGTGTLGRNPEIKWRLKPQDLDDLHARQSALLASARAALAPGGILVYSTCSLEPEENQGVTAVVPEALVAATMSRIPGRDAGDGFYACVIKSA
jgi:16S rRNA (cytosine967-C5)-methyltransferase